MQELTTSQKERLKSVFSYLAEKCIFFLLILAGLYIVFWGNLPSHIDKVIIQAIFGQNYDNLHKLAENDLIRLNYTSGNASLKNDSKNG